MSGRAKSHAQMYFGMCARKLVEYRSLVSNLKKTDSFSDDFDELAIRVDEAAIEPVVYAGMALEATLFELAVCLFGDAYAKQIDTLGPLDKFCEIAKRIDRVGPDAASVTVQQIKALVKARNLLVHYKSMSWLSDMNAAIAEGRKQHQVHMDGIKASFRSLVLVSCYFDGNIFEELRILPSFKKPEYWKPLVPPELHEDVYWCQQKSKSEAERARNRAATALVTPIETGEINIACNLGAEANTQGKP